jgi:hypothetical protein
MAVTLRFCSALLGSNGDCHSLQGSSTQTAHSGFVLHQSSHHQYSVILKSNLSLLITQWSTNPTNKLFSNSISITFCSWPCFVIGSRCVDQAGLKLAIVLLQPPQCWDYRHASLHPACIHLIAASCFSCLGLFTHSMLLH